jgi:hypothetical protein
MLWPCSRNLLWIGASIISHRGVDPRVLGSSFKGGYPYVRRNLCRSQAADVAWVMRSGRSFLCGVAWATREGDEMGGCIPWVTAR